MIFAHSANRQTGAVLPRPGHKGSKTSRGCASRPGRHHSTVDRSGSDCAVPSERRRRKECSVIAVQPDRAARRAALPLSVLDQVQHDLPTAGPWSPQGPAGQRRHNPRLIFIRAAQIQTTRNGAATNFSASMQVHSLALRRHQVPNMFNLLQQASRCGAIRDDQIR